MLRSHGVAHVFNSWTRMPPVVEQLEMEGSMTADFTVGRFLLKPGRKYEEAVNAFSPYEDIKEVYEDGRVAIVKLVTTAKLILRGRSYIYINNRLEGNALKTIVQALSSLEI